MKNLTNKIIQVLCILLITSTMSLQAESVLKIIIQLIIVQ